MKNIKHCSQCGVQIHPDAKFCTNCGTNITTTQSSSIETNSNKSATTALLICLFLGALGLHRFYVGKIKTGILMLLTGGGLVIWALVDSILITCSSFTDKKGKRLIYVKGRVPSLKLALIIICTSICAMVIDFFLLFSLLMYFTNPLTITVQEQLSALRANDMNKAYSYMANETKTTVSLDNFIKYIAHNPAITSKSNLSIPERDIQNNTGYVRVLLKTNDGGETTVEYRLIKEDGAWKIVAFRVNTTKSAHSSPQIFSDETNHYTIQYPGDWQYKKTGKHSMLFEGKQGTRSHYSSIIIQVVPAESVGVSKNLSTVMDDLKKQISIKRQNVNILNSGPVELPTDTKNIHGESFIATYTLKGHALKEMQFILSRDNNKTLYSWTYISPVEQYDIDLPIAKAMYESWKIK